MGFRPYRFCEFDCVLNSTQIMRPRSYTRQVINTIASCTLSVINWPKS